MLRSPTTACMSSGSCEAGHTEDNPQRCKPAKQNSVSQQFDSAHVSKYGQRVCLKCATVFQLPNCRLEWKIVHVLGTLPGLMQIPLTPVISNMLGISISVSYIRCSQGVIHNWRKLTIYKHCLFGGVWGDLKKKCLFSCLYCIYHNCTNQQTAVWKMENNVM